MSIDLESKDGRKKYLSDKLDDLLEGINSSYGVILMEELLNRLELTIMDFNNEMKTLCDQLVNKQKERQHLLEMLNYGERIPSNISTKMPGHKGTTASEASDTDIPDWERKLAKLEKKEK